MSRSGGLAAARRSIRIVTTGEGVPRALNVILINGGPYGDAIMTQHTRLALARQQDGSWKFLRIYKSQEKWPR